MVEAVVKWGSVLYMLVRNHQMRDWKIMALSIHFLICGCSETQPQSNSSDVSTKSETRPIDYQYIEELNPDTLDFNLKLPDNRTYLRKGVNDTIAFSIKGVPKQNTILSGPSMSIIFFKDSTDRYAVRAGSPSTDADTAYLNAFVTIQDTMMLRVKSYAIPLK